MKNLGILLAALPTAAVVIAGCSGGDKKHAVVPTTTYVQIERLGRPGINEALVVTNDYLNAFNSIPPSADLSSAATPVLTEAAGVLTVFDSLDNTAGNAYFGLGLTGEVNAFLPDVMRIDTTYGTGGTGACLAAVTATSGAYGTCLSNFPPDAAKNNILTGGRKIEDDVIDITLFALTGFPPGVLTDGVSYKGAAGNPNQGHQKLHGALDYNKAATFPYLAKPN